MIHNVTYLLIAALVLFGKVCGCDDENVPTFYPTAANYVDEEIDTLLTRSEEMLFASDFKEALFNVERAESLLPLTNDEHDHRKLRCMFDKAIVVTCVEGLTDGSLLEFKKFNTLLGSKSCGKVFVNFQENLFDQNGHWPIVNDGPISVGECIDRVKSIQSKLETACSFLKVTPKVHFGILCAIFSYRRNSNQLLH